MRRIAVLMTCFNRVQKTLACLDDFIRQVVPDGYSVDIYLVDDGSPDKTGEKVLARFPHVHVIQGTGNLFWCKGMRLAWDTASKTYPYDFYLWLNDDVRFLDAAALSCMIRDYETLCNAHPDGAIVVLGSFYNSPNKDFICYGGDDTPGHRIVPNGKPVRSCSLAGNFVLVSKAVFDRVGPIYGGYNHGYGDYDYARLMLKANIPFYVASRVLGWCEMNQGLKVVSSLSIRQRIGLLFKPTGYNLHDAFIFRLRHDGLVRAMVSVAHIACKVLIMRKGYGS